MFNPCTSTKCSLLQRLILLQLSRPIGAIGCCALASLVCSTELSRLHGHCTSERQSGSLSWECRTPFANLTLRRGYLGLNEIPYVVADKRILVKSIATGRIFDTVRRGVRTIIASESKHRPPFFAPNRWSVSNHQTSPFHPTYKTKLPPIPTPAC